MLTFGKSKGLGKVVLLEEIIKCCLCCMIIGKEKSSYSLNVLVWITLETEPKRRIWVQVISLGSGSKKTSVGKLRQKWKAANKGNIIKYWARAGGRGGHWSSVLQGTSQSPLLSHSLESPHLIIAPMERWSPGYLSTNSQPSLDEGSLGPGTELLSSTLALP